MKKGKMAWMAEKHTIHCDERKLEILEYNFNCCWNPNHIFSKIPAVKLNKYFCPNPKLLNTIMHYAIVI